MSRLFRTFLFIFLVATSFHLFSQTKNAPTPGLESPYNTMWVHLYYLQPDTYAPEISARTISDYSDTAQAIKTALQIKQILDGSGLFVNMDEIPRDSNYVDSTTNKPYYTPFPRVLPEIYLEKIDGRWYYSMETVGLIPTLHKSVYPLGSDFLINLTPTSFGQRKIFGVAFWQYLGFVVLLLLLFLFHLLLSRLLNPLVRRLSSSRLNPGLVSEELIWKIARVLSILIILQVFKMLFPALLLEPGMMEGAVLVFKILTTVFILILLLRIIDLVMLYAHRFTKTTTTKLDEQLLPIVRKMIQVVLVIGAVIQILALLKVDILPLIAGVSIGGLALALAAQDTVKNLIGSAMIFVDQPFQIGDYITGGGVSGTVEEVGFRTTRLRQVDSSIIAVPNGTIANAAITNLGMRSYRLFQTTLGVTYDTPPELLEKFIEGLRQIIDVHPFTNKDNYMVYFSELGASSMNVLFRTYLDVPDYKNELKAKDQMLFTIIRLAAVLGVQFAFPSSTVYVEKFPGKISNSPTYEKNMNTLEEKLKAFIEDYKNMANENENENENEN